MVPSLSLIAWRGPRSMPGGRLASPPLGLRPHKRGIRAWARRRSNIYLFASSVLGLQVVPLPSVRPCSISCHEGVRRLFLALHHIRSHAGAPCASGMVTDLLLSSLVKLGLLAPRTADMEWSAPGWERSPSPAIGVCG